MYEILLPDNSHASLAQLKSLEKRLWKDMNLKTLNTPISFFIVQLLFILNSNFCHSIANAIRSLYLLATEEKLKKFKPVFLNLPKGYVVPFSTEDSTNGSDREWYVPHHLVRNPNKSGKARCVLNSESKYHGNPLNNFLFVDMDLLKNRLFHSMHFQEL